MRPVRIAPSDTVVRHGPDGSIYMESPFPLGPYASKLTERLELWAAESPDRTFVAERDACHAAERAGELVPTRSPDVTPAVLTTRRPLCNHVRTVPRTNDGGSPERLGPAVGPAANGREVHGAVLALYGAACSRGDSDTGIG